MKNIHEIAMVILDLIENSIDYVTAKKIADVLGVSVRSVMRYINVINATDTNTSFKIIAIPNKGFKLEVISEEKYKEYKASIMDSSLYSSEYLELFFNLLLNESCSQSFLSDILSMSESSLFRYVENLNRKLDTKKISIAKKNQFYVMEGDELRIRNFFVSLLQEYKDTFEKWLLKDSTLLMYREIQTFVNQNSSLIQSQKLSILLFVSIQRIHHKRRVTLNPLMQYLFTELDLQSEFIKEIDGFFLSRLHMDFPSDEKVYLWLFTLSESNTSIDFTDFIQLLEPFISSGLKNIDEKFGTFFQYDSDLKNGLLYHISTSLIKYLIFRKSDNKMIDEIRLTYTNAYCYALELTNYIYEQLRIEIDENDIGYITLHFATSIEKMANEEIYEGYILSKSNITTANLLKARIENRYRNIRILGIIESVSEALSHDSLIFSCENQTDHPQVIHISPFVTNVDAILISKALLERSGYKPFVQLCYPENFISFDQALDKNSVLDSMIEHLKKHGYLTEEEAIMVIAREKLSSTEIALNVAFPHVLIKGKSFLSVAILKQPILWKDNVVKLVLLMGLKENDTHAKEAIKYLFKNIANQDKLNQLIKTKSFSEFIATIKE